MSCGESYTEFQGKFPVIYLSFKDVKFNSWEETFEKLKSLLSLEALRHSELLRCDNISQYEKEYFSKLLSGNVNTVDLSMALSNLSMMLDEFYQVKPIIIIDEYDTPILQGHLKGFYDEIITFIRNLFSGGFKDNPHLSFGFLTGILSVAKESIFSGMNNLVINSIMDDKYSQYFGFTKKEIIDMTKYYHAENKYQEICDWYDGYLFGKTEIFNPWSVINYFRNDFKPLPYWVSTSGNEIILETLSQADKDIYEQMSTLLQGNTITSSIDVNIIYPQVRENPSSIFSFLLVSGYLKVISKKISFTGDYLCEIKIPNKEIRYVYNKEIMNNFKDIIPLSRSLSIQEALAEKDTDKLQEKLQEILLQSASYYDSNKENFYQGLMLGLCVTMDELYKAASNREPGNGRYDICLCPKKEGYPGIIIELKSMKNANESKSNNLALKAIQQIKDNKYETELRAKEINEIFCYGVAFSGKKAKVKFLQIQ